MDDLSMEQPVARDSLIGVTIGNYEIRSKIGAGGMGSVYLAEHPRIGKKVALKILHPEYSQNEDVAGRFFDEARSVTNIQHPNIVDIFDYGTLDNNGQRAYFVMEYLDGCNLNKLIRKAAPLESERALGIAMQIADALNASHARGIVHRDLKPDNIMLIQRGRQRDFVKVLDFGIAKLSEEARPMSRKTRTGVVMGTPHYMSPEQCDGAGNIDHRTDLYSVGILLFEMLTGQVPFRGDAFTQVLIAQVSQPPPMPSILMPNINPYIEAVVLGALAKVPDNRFPNAEELMKALADPKQYIASRGGLSPFLSAALAPLPGAPALTMSARSYSPTGQYAAPKKPSISDSAVGSAPGVDVGLDSVSRSAPGIFDDDELEIEITKGRSPRIGIIAAVVTFVLAVSFGAYVFLLGGDRGGDKQPAVASSGDSAATGGALASAAGTAPEAPARGADTDDNAPTAGEGGADDKEPSPASGAEPGAEGGDENGSTPTPAAETETESISVTVISDPEGADVYVGDEQEPRGQTPVRFELPKSSGEVELAIKRDGYRTRTRTLALTSDKELDLQLRKLTKRTAKKDTRRKKRRGKNKSSKDSDQNNNRDNDESEENDEFDVGLQEPDWD